MQVKDVTGYIRRAGDISIVLGAGASRSAGVPAAPELVEKINKEFNHCLNQLTPDERKDYGKVMGALSPGDRKSLIEPILQRSSINWGHIALACIIRSRNVRRILTFNFDLILERSASLLGMHLPVYDFGVAPTRDISGLAAPAIFHLHGQSYGLRQMNSDIETTEHRESLRPLLADSLRNHLTVIIGYSGEADPALEVMAKEFNSQNNLIWLGYSKEPKEHLFTLLNKDYADYVGGCDFDRTMIKIAEGLGCWPPEIIKNPPAHVLKELEEVVDYPVQAEKGADMLTSTRQRLDQAASVWEKEKDSTARAQEALISGAEQEDADNIADMSETERIARAWSAVGTGNELADEAETLDGAERAEKLALAQQKYAQALEIKPDKHEALNNWGAALAKEAETLDGAERAEKFALAQQKYAQALEIKPNGHETLYNWGLALADEAETLDAAERAEKFALAQQKFAQALEIKPDMHEALINWGVALAKEAETLDAAERAEKFALAQKKFAQALEIKPDNHEALGGWGLTLLHIAQPLNGAERAEKLAEAESKFLTAKEMTKQADYNLACVYALTGDIDAAMNELFACLADGVLPTADHLATDSDMDPLRADPRFQDLLEKLTNPATPE